MKETMTMPKIAILGFAIESNRFAPVSSRVAFYRTLAILLAKNSLTDSRSAAPAMTPEIPVFVRAMGETGPWTPAPILFANAESGGPLAMRFFTETCAAFREGLKAAMPLDAVYICEHGAAITTEDRVRTEPSSPWSGKSSGRTSPSSPRSICMRHFNRMVDAVDVLIS